MLRIDANDCLLLLPTPTHMHTPLSDLAAQNKRTRLHTLSNPPTLIARDMKKQLSDKQVSSLYCEPT